MRESIRQTIEGCGVVQCHEIIDDEPTVLQNHGYYAFRMFVPGWIPATIRLSVGEPEVKVHLVFADRLAAENRELRRTSCFIWSGEESVLQPWDRGFVLVCAEKIAETLVVIVFARLKNVEFLDKSFAQERPEGFLCPPLGKAQWLVSGDVGVENARGVERGLRGIAVTLARVGARGVGLTRRRTWCRPCGSLSHRATSES